MKKLWMLLAVAAISGCSMFEKDTTEATLTWDETPIAVRKGVEQAFPDAKVKKIEREEYKDTKVVEYEVELVTKTGEKKEVKFAADGERLDKPSKR